MNQHSMFQEFTGTSAHEDKGSPPRGRSADHCPGNILLSIFDKWMNDGASRWFGGVLGSKKEVTGVN